MRRTCEKLWPWYACPEHARQLDSSGPSSQAELALANDETPVGCVFVHGGRIIGRGMNDTNRSLNVGLDVLSLRVRLRCSVPGHQACRVGRPGCHPAGPSLLRLARDGRLRERGAVHHVCLGAAAVADPCRVLWLSQRTLRRHGGGSLCARRVRSPLAVPPQSFSSPAATAPTRPIPYTVACSRTTPSPC